MITRMIRSLSRGYNWIDLAFLLGLALVSMSLAAPSIYEAYREYGLVRVAEGLADTLELAQSLAITQGATYQVQFDSRERCFQILRLSESEQAVVSESPLGPKVSLSFASGYPIAFDSKGGTKGGSASLSNSSGSTVRVEVGRSGRIAVRAVQNSPG